MVKKISKDEQTLYRRHLLKKSGAGCEIQETETFGSISCPTVESNEQFRDFLVKEKQLVESDKAFIDTFPSFGQRVTPEFSELISNIQDFTEKRIIMVEDEINAANDRIGRLKSVTDQGIQRTDSDNDLGI